jgi:hypothetical protein
MDGKLSDWEGGPALKLGESSPPNAELRSSYDGQSLYLALTIPKFEADEARNRGSATRFKLEWLAV